jgi:very-short-patch-repair endonuclease
MWSPANDEERQAIIQAYIAGVYIHKIAAETHHSRQSIRQVLVDAGVEIRLQGGGAAPSDEKVEAIVQRYNDGDWVDEIAEEFKYSPASIRRILKNAGITVKWRGRTCDVGPANTPIEQRLHDALRKAGIGFVTQRNYVKNYIVDIRINQMPIIIEADGIQHTWDDKLDRDTKRDRAHEEIGFKTFRFTGSQICSDATACIQRVIDECGLTPDENPVYDVRSGFNGSDHPRYVNDRQEYTCEVCGTVFIARQAHRSWQQTTCCSLKCFHKTRSSKPSKPGRPHSQETKTKISITMQNLPRIPIWCDECQRSWVPAWWKRHINKYHSDSDVLTSD